MTFPAELERLVKAANADKEESSALRCFLEDHADAILGLVRAMESIANNTCCEGCQEAKRVAVSALAKLNGGKG